MHNIRFICNIISNVYNAYKTISTVVTIFLMTFSRMHQQLSCLLWDCNIVAVKHKCFNFLTPKFFLF